VCRGYNLVVEPGTTVALVGASGSGKSTAIQLCERFYDPEASTVRLDGVSMQDLNVTWVRGQIGLVGQEPVLFTGSVAENITYGKAGAMRVDVEEAAKLANAHDFIVELSDSYDTQVGLRGGRLSGGPDGGAVRPVWLRQVDDHLAHRALLRPTGGADRARRRRHQDAQPAVAAGPTRAATQTRSRSSTRARSSKKGATTNSSISVGSTLTSSRLKSSAQK